MKYLLKILMVFIISGNNLNAQNSTPNFKYRDILEDYIDSIQPEIIPDFFGTWIITSIAKVGGSLENEKLIQAQIGHELSFSNDSLMFNFLARKIKINKPIYSIDYLSHNENLKETSLFYGYRMCRKSVIMLDVSKRLYLEVIRGREMAYFYDGRIYFLTREN